MTCELQRSANQHMNCNSMSRVPHNCCMNFVREDWMNEICIAFASHPGCACPMHINEPASCCKNKHLEIIDSTRGRSPEPSQCSAICIYRLAVQLVPNLVDFLAHFHIMKRVLFYAAAALLLCAVATQARVLVDREG